jgi:hypothetical protein
MARKEAVLRKQFGLEWGLIERSGYEPTTSKQLGARRRGKP